MRYTILKTVVVMVVLSVVFMAHTEQIKNYPVTLADKKASAPTKALYYNLKQIAPTKTLFGHQDDLAYGIGWKDEKGRSDIKDVCGDYPAVYGWDIGWLGKEEINLDTVNFKKMRKWMIEGYKRGGINTISWHIDNLVTGGGSWDTTTCVKHILPNGKAHDIYKQRLDALAKFCKSLKTGWFGKPIPVIFRPFHEHTGSWFWWGKGNTTATDYKQLWKFTVDYLKNEKDVHNLIYCYATDVVGSVEQYLEFYPGDDYVDILGIDNYAFVKDKVDIPKTVKLLEMIVNLAAEKGKIAALTETGHESVPIDNWWTEVLLKSIQATPKTSKIAWVHLWRNAWIPHHYTPYKGHPSEANFKQFYQDSTTVFENDLPDMYR